MSTPKVAKLRKWAADRQCPACHRKHALQVGHVTELRTRQRHAEAACDYCGYRGPVPEALEHLLSPPPATDE